MLRADLQAIRNLIRTSEGRKVLLGNAIVLGCMVLGSLAISARFFLADDVLEVVRKDESGALASLYYAAALLLPILALLGLGVTQVGIELYRAPQITVLLTAPISSFVIVRRSWLRSVVVWLLLCAAIGWPPVLGLATEARLALGPVLMYPVAALVLIAPIVAAQTLAKVVLTRWFSGARLRLVLTGLYVSVCVALGLFVALGFFSNERMVEQARGWMPSEPSLPWWLASPASLLAWSAGFPVSPASLASNLLLVAASAPFLALATLAYRGSYEAHGLAGRAIGRRATVGRRSWPEAPFRSFLVKGRVESLRVRSHLVTLAVIGLLMVVFLKNGAAGEASAVESLVPTAMRQGLSLLVSWYALVLLVACLCFAAVVGDEQKQIGLLAAAPFARQELLKSKLVTLMTPFLMCLGIVLLLSVPVAGVEPGAVGVVALAAPAVLAFLLGLIAAVGTWPVAVRVHDQVPLANNLRSILPVLLISGAGLLVMKGLFMARGTIIGAWYGNGWLESLGGPRAALVMLGVAWCIGAAVLIFGCRVALSNLERLLGPQ